MPNLLPITLTPLAVREIKAILRDKGLSAAYGLRVGIKGGGCGGASFLLGFDTAQPTDEQFVLEGIPVLVDKKHTMYLLGLEIDFEDGAQGRGFAFHNPSVPRPAEPS